MKLLIVLLFLYFTISKGTIVQKTFYNGPSCSKGNGGTQHIEYSSLCNFQNYIEINSDIVFYNKNVSKPYECIRANYVQNGTQENSKCSNYTLEGFELSKQIIVNPNINSFSSLISSLPENTCNDMYFVDSSCMSNYYIYSYTNNKCMNLKQGNETGSIRISCDSQSFTKYVYALADCEGGSNNNVIVAKSPYQNGSCSPAQSASGAPVNVFHSFYYKPISIYESISETDSDNNENPNDSTIQIIPTLLILISILFVSLI